MHDKAKSAKAPSVFLPSDFQYDAEARACTCPAGKSLYRKGKQLSRAKVNGQWTLFCLVQNIEKLARSGYAACGTVMARHGRASRGR